MAGKYLLILMMVGPVALGGCATSTPQDVSQLPHGPVRASDSKSQAMDAHPNTAGASHLQTDLTNHSPASQLTAETANSIAGAMAKAYRNNPDLNATRAGLRATDEGVPIAKAGFRPQIGATATGTNNRLDNPAYGKTFNYYNSSANILITQPLFDGFQTLNNVLAAQSNVFSARASLREKEISIMLAAAQSYANIARDQEVVIIRKQNLASIRQQQDATESLKGVGEATRTDMSQVQAQLAESEALLVNAVAQLKESQAVFMQIVGDMPMGIKTPSPVAVPFAATVDEAVNFGLRNNPSISSADYDVDAAGYRIKSAEGALLPGVVIQGALSRDLSNLPNSSGDDSNTASVTVRLQVPIYQGGSEYGQIRKAKEELGQQQFVAFAARATVRQAIMTTYAQRDAALANVIDTKKQISAANRALSGVVEERKIGQRTTMDVLNAQQSVLVAKEALVNAERNATVSSYTLLAMMGLLALRPEDGPPIDAVAHYTEVKDRWTGVGISSDKKVNSRID